MRAVIAARASRQQFGHLYAKLQLKHGVPSSVQGPEPKLVCKGEMVSVALIEDTHTCMTLPSLDAGKLKTQRPAAAHKIDHEEFGGDPRCEGSPSRAPRSASASRKISRPLAPRRPPARSPRIGSRCLKTPVSKYAIHAAHDLRTRGGCGRSRGRDPVPGDAHSSVLRRAGSPVISVATGRPFI